MSWKLFLDDERFPGTEEGWEIARSSLDATILVQTKGMPSEIAFDHDLGYDEEGNPDTAMIFISWMVDQYYEGRLEMPPNFTYTVHSQNPVGVKNIKGWMEGWLHDAGLK